MTARPEIGRFVEELREFVRFPSISTDPAHAADVAACGRWLARHLRGIGMDRVDPTRVGIYLGCGEGIQDFPGLVSILAQNYQADQRRVDHAGFSAGASGTSQIDL